LTLPFCWNSQARDFDKALDGFTHAVQLDPENGEAWNNIAFLYAVTYSFIQSSLKTFFFVYN